MPTRKLKFTRCRASHIYVLQTYGPVSPPHSLQEPSKPERASSPRLNRTRGARHGLPLVRDSSTSIVHLHPLNHNIQYPMSPLPHTSFEQYLNHNPPTTSHPHPIPITPPKTTAHAPSKTPPKRSSSSPPPYQPPTSTTQPTHPNHQQHPAHAPTSSPWHLLPQEQHSAQ